MTEENKLNGNDAVNLAAEQSKETAHRNIPELGFEDMPLDADTANLRYGPSLHDGLLALLPLVGVWAGSGQANDPSDPFPEVTKLLTVDEDFESWDALSDKFFDEESGTITQIIAASGKGE